MPAATRMNGLAERKRLLIAQANLHRELIAAERLRLQDHWHSTHDFVGQNRWWLLGSAIAGGVLLAANWRGVTRWLPTLIATWRALKG